MTTTTDPFAALEQAARQQKAEEDAGNQVQKGLVKLILGKDAKSPFFATLAMRLKHAVNWDIETACVDGRTLEYNPDFVNSLSMPQTIGLLAHEVMHCAGKHMCRRAGRDMSRWNIACDLEINPILRDCGVDMPPGGLLPGQGQYKDLPKGEAAERYYGLLPDEDGQGNDPGKCGGVKDAGDKAQQQATSAEMDVAALQAAEASKGRGKLPAGVDRLVQAIKKPKVDWRSILREYVSTVARNDYSWSPPNRRYVHMGLYLPSLRSEELGDVLLCVDTSGSIGQAELETFASEASGIFETFNCTVDIVYHDSDVQHIEHWEPSDGELKLAPKGGGGTSHTWLPEYLQEHGEPTVLVIFSDCDSCWPMPPSCPAIVVRAGRFKGSPPAWGRLVDVEISGGS